MNITHYRKAYFACAKSLGMDADDRHAFNQALVGKPSTRDFSVADWRAAVAELQRMTGQDTQPSRPRLRGRRDADEPAEPETPGVETITPAQLESVYRLAERVRWKISVHAWIRSRLTLFRKRTWNGEIETLFRDEARAALAGLRRMANAAQAPPPESR